MFYSFNWTDSFALSRPSLPPAPPSPEYRMHDLNKRLSMRTEVGFPRREDDRVECRFILLGM